ncbi:hypothetical protein MAMC_00996 [Methylacidimicrobium cyclopophantes]|uniref:Uncharacterized protein n=1 Tax=Methylacidimicrobium cyclopophantes TaxID=1041766 RepID=A0A5E6MB73_9BACT|nr:hypothetical protein [Methylacidimicrobium cyclopophantes]VVM06220.1 hypothetical protein MAMC_00996 [Methylacidimicrobium cyclopophantes]
MRQLLHRRLPGVALLPLLFLFCFLPESIAASSGTGGYQQNQAFEASPLMEAIMQFAFQMGTLLRQNGLAIAQGVMPYVLFSAATFAGWRILFGRPILDELLDYTLLAFLAWLLIYAQAPQLLIDRYRQALITSGQQIGLQIAQMATTDSGVATPSGPNPAVWWFHWIGLPSGGPGGSGAPASSVSPEQFKFGPVYIGSVMFQNVFHLSGSGQTSNPFENIQLYQQLKTALQSLLGALGIGGGNPSPNESTNWNTMLLYGIPLITSLGMVLGLIVTAAILAISAVFTLVFTQLLIVAGSEIAYQSLLAFGLAMIPFIFFTSFRGVWRPMLQALVATALVPTLYFIFSGVGYALAQTIFHFMFGSGQQQDHAVLGWAVPTILQAMVGWPTLTPGSSSSVTDSPNSVAGSVINVIQQIVGPVGQGLSQLLTASLRGLLEVAGAWAFYGLGVNIVAAFVHAGSMFPFVAARIAFGWSSAFADMAGALLEGFTQSYSRIHGAVTEGLRSAGQDSIGRVSGWVQSVASRPGPR